MFKLLTAFAMTTLYAPVYAGLFDYSPAKGVMYPGTLLSFSLIITPANVITEKGGKGEGTHIFDAYRSTCTSYVIKEGNYESIWIGQKYNGCIYFYDTSDCNPDNDENYLYQQSLYVESEYFLIVLSWRSLLTSGKLAKAPL
jgi:hypothetical protein